MSRAEGSGRLRLALRCLGAIPGSILYGVTPTDPATFATVAAGMMIIALLACYVPARRAARVDPLTAIRAE